MNSDKANALRDIRTVLAASLACTEEELMADGVTVRTAQLREGRLRFPARRHSLQLVTLGQGAVIACSADRADWAREQLEPLDRGRLFTPRTLALLEQYVRPDRQYMAGPDQKYAISRSELRAFPVPESVKLTRYLDREMAELYRYTEFRHALSFRPESERPDRIAFAAECGGEIVGIAGVSEDSERLWQIGVDVSPAHQGRGIGRALVGALTAAVLDAGVTPYYSTALGNLASSQLAVSLGYWPAWLEVYARDGE